MGWHFPIVSGETASRWAENKFWVIYKEPACPQLRAALLEMDRLSRQKYGYVVGAFARPETAAEHQYYTWGVDSVQRFDDSGQRLVKPKKTRARAVRRARGAGTRGVRHGGCRIALPEIQGKAAFLSFSHKQIDISISLAKFEEVPGPNRCIWVRLSRPLVVFSESHTFSRAFGHWRDFGSWALAGIAGNHRGLPYKGISLGAFSILCLHLQEGSHHCLHLHLRPREHPLIRVHLRSDLDLNV